MIEIGADALAQWKLEAFRKIVISTEKDPKDRLQSQSGNTAKFVSWQWN